MATDSSKRVCSANLPPISTCTHFKGVEDRLRPGKRYQSVIVMALTDMYSSILPIIVIIYRVILNEKGLDSVHRTLDPLRCYHIFSFVQFLYMW